MARHAEPPLRVGMSVAAWSALPTPVRCSTSYDRGCPATPFCCRTGSNRMLKNPSRLSFRGAAGDEESRKFFVSRARFLASLGMTTFTSVFQHPAKASLGQPVRTLR